MPPPLGVKLLCSATALDVILINIMCFHAAPKPLCHCMALSISNLEGHSVTLMIWCGNSQKLCFSSTRKLNMSACGSLENAHRGSLGLYRFFGRRLLCTVFSEGKDNSRAVKWPAANTHTSLKIIGGRRLEVCGLDSADTSCLSNVLLIPLHDWWLWSQHLCSFHCLRHHPFLFWLETVSSQRKHTSWCLKINKYPFLPYFCFYPLSQQWLTLVSHL